MKKFDSILNVGDLRSIGESNKVVSLIDHQQAFDELFQHLFHTDRIVAMRTADAIEKITLKNTDYLKPHKNELLKLMDSAIDIELKWHLALLISRLNLTKNEFKNVWIKLTEWARNNLESKIVRVNSLQALHDLSLINSQLIADFNQTLAQVEKENIPSINARIRKLKREVVPKTISH